MSRYDAIAHVYERILRAGSIGQIEDLYRAVAGELEEMQGASVLELGCGPAAVTPFLLEKVGPSGSVLGVDLSEKMIDVAREKAARLGWSNAHFETADAAAYVSPSPMDAVVCSLFLTVLPDSGPCLEHALRALRPGGRLVILDSIPEPERRLARLVIRAKAPLVGARPSTLPLDFSRRHLEDLRVRYLFGGVYTLISGRRPTEAGAG